MAIEDDVKKVLTESEEREKNCNFQNLKDFYEYAKREGFAMKQEYTLPQFDSIGRRLYSTQKANREQQ